MAARVLAVAQVAELGGAEYALLRVARLLPERGFELELTVPGAGALQQAAEAEGMTVHHLAVGGIERGGWPRALFAWPRAGGIARRARPDLVLLNGLVAQRAAPGLPGTLVPWVHDLVDQPPRPWRSPRFWARAPVVLCASRAVARAAAAAGAPEERLRVVYCPVDAPEPAPRPAWAGRRPVVGFVGRIEPRKGTLDLLRAFGEVRARVPDALLVIVGADELGADPAYAEQVRAEAERHGDSVLALGVVPGAASLMSWFDVLAVPSLEEPFGTVAAEALAAGTPVVATRSGGMEEYVEHGRSGMLVPPGDPQQLAEALAFLVEQGAGMTDAARAAAAPFASDRVADGVAAALREALG
jgi:glycosyltransferase involved in cell wall biosynthesis